MSVEIFNSLGKLITISKVQLNKINIEYLTSGVYYMIS